MGPSLRLIYGAIIHKAVDAALSNTKEKRK